MDTTSPWTTAAEQGDSSSTDDVESPRSVVSAAAIAAARAGSRRSRRKSFNSKVRDYNNNKTCLHSQVVRIKEEEMQISEDLVVDCFTCYNNYVADCHSLDDVWFGRTALLPSSPLGSKKD